METAIWNLKVEIAFAVYFIGLDFFSLIYNKVKSGIQSKKTLSQEDMKDSIEWLCYR